MSRQAPAFSVSPLDRLSPALWADAFGEEEGEVRHIIDLLSPDALAVCAAEDGRQVFQGVMIPLLFGDALGYYLYALSTDRAYRGRGYLRKALSFIRDHAKSVGASFLLLIPSGEELAAAYRRMGFSDTLALTASPDGCEGYLSLKKSKEEIPFDGDEERLYLLTERTLPLSAFRAYLASLPEGARIFYTQNGFCIRVGDESDLCLLSDARTAKASLLKSKASALLQQLAPTPLPPLADPLPR